MQWLVGRESFLERLLARRFLIHKFPIIYIPLSQCNNSQCWNSSRCMQTPTNYDEAPLLLQNLILQLQIPYLLIIAGPVSGPLAPPQGETHTHTNIKPPWRKSNIRRWNLWILLVLFYCTLLSNVALNFYPIPISRIRSIVNAWPEGKDYHTFGYQQSHTWKKNFPLQQSAK